MRTLDQVRQTLERLRQLAAFGSGEVTRGSTTDPDPGGSLAVLIAKPTVEPGRPRARTDHLAAHPRQLGLCRGAPRFAQGAAQERLVADKFQLMRSRAGIAEVQGRTCPHERCCLSGVCREGPTEPCLCAGGTRQHAHQVTVVLGEPRFEDVGLGPKVLELRMRRRLSLGL